MHAIFTLSLFALFGSTLCDPGYMSVVDTWRANMGLADLSWDAQLENNALKTVVDGNGEMRHELNPGTMAQVLAPGSVTDNFQHVFVGGWLCEVPETPGLGDICATESVGWDYNGQTGHNKILTDPAYTKIGCAEAVGIVSCDLA